MKNILILEDDLMLAMQWAKALGAHNYGVQITTGAEQALEVFAAQEFDLCIVDFLIHVAGKPTPDGGITFLGKMDPFKRKKTKIIGVSGMTDNIMAIGADELFFTFGAQQFIQKPFPDKELVSQVNLILSN